MKPVQLAAALPLPFLLVALTLAGFATPLPGQDDAEVARRFRERLEVRRVNVEVFVTDRRGNPITGLTAADFQLFEDGKKVPITNFAFIGETAPPGGPATTEAAAGESAAATLPLAPAAAAEPRHLLVYTDLSSLRPGSLQRVTGELRRFLDHHLAPEDRVMMLVYDHSLKLLTPFTSDPAAIDGALDRLETSVGRGLFDDAEHRSLMDRIATLLDDLADAQTPPASNIGFSRPEPDRSGPSLDMLLSEIRSYAQGIYERDRVSARILEALVASLAGVPGRKALLHVSEGVALRPADDLYRTLQDLLMHSEVRLGARSRPGAKAQGEKRGGSDAIGDEARFTTHQLGQLSGLWSEGQQLDLTRDFRDLTARANAARVSLYTLNAGGGGSAVTGADFKGIEMGSMTAGFVHESRLNRQEGIRFLADETGGLSLAGGDGIEDFLGRMWGDFGAHYSLAFEPRAPVDGAYHEIEVKLANKSGLVVRHRQGYASLAAEDELRQRLAATLALGVDDNPLGVVIETGEKQPRGGDHYQVPFLIKVPLAELETVPEGATRTGEVMILIAWMGADGRMTPVQLFPRSFRLTEAEPAGDGLYAFRFDVNMPLGEQRVAVGVVDGLTSRAAFLGHPLKLE